MGGRYQLGPVLGRGGMAEVRRGRDLKLDRPVALKLLRPDLASHRAIRASFEGEARSAARLRHPHVVSIFDTGEDRGVPYIVMELLPGATLADRIRAGRLEESAVRPLAAQVLGALDAAHSAGILHRDVKPANILFDDEGGAKVTDFGIAQAMEGGVAAELTSPGDVLGTPTYVAPERTEGRAASPASDLWSLGVVLYEALTQKRPFPGDTAVAAALSAQQGSMTPLSRLRPDLSPRLVATLERAVAPRPADRFTSAAAMAADLGVGLA
ncbi:MAG: serine/threonine protein kinase, partial [Acidimicrobiales bacterium]|nr:serine/threonine protein kinase [Acidimicrobiales bacterium]